MSSTMSFCVITGANRGIGLALAVALKARGSTVLAACRQSSAGLNALGVEVVEGVEVTEDGGAERLAHAVGTRDVDLLINNAGILIGGSSLERFVPADIQKQFDVNALGPLRVTVALRERLKRGSKVALVTSRMGSIEDNSSGGEYGYRMSKAALNMAGKSLAIDLKASGVAVALLHPGMVRTEMVGAYGQVEPADAARGLLARLDELTLETSGGFWHANGQTLPW
jgi:NAD(P)-dependent dehydrogenase (short-subunit alcohol dehydrogenase family)